jgi:hypothetical protein
VGLIARAVDEHADLSMFQDRPSGRLVAGIVAIVLSMLVAWPSMTVLTAVAVWLERPLWAVAGAPLLYGLSWAIWGIGLLLSGRDTAKYAHALGRWAIRKFAERFLLNE